MKSLTVSFLFTGICRHGMQYWIGLNDRTTDGVYVWNDETTPVSWADLTFIFDGLS